MLGGAGLGMGLNSMLMQQQLLAMQAIQQQQQLKSLQTGGAGIAAQLPTASVGGSAVAGGAVMGAEGVPSRRLCLLNMLSETVSTACVLVVSYEAKECPS
jgi:hypothetical protein